MSLIISTTEQVFNPQDIEQGDLIRAKYSGWGSWRNGIVTAVQPDKLTVLFLPGVGNVTNYFQIAASEVEAGSWAVKWTTDLVTIKTEGVGA